jgi:hypothetical protein
MVQETRRQPIMAFTGRVMHKMFSRWRMRSFCEFLYHLDPPDHTLKLLDTTANPGTTQRWHSPGTTYRSPHKMVNQGWSQGPCRGRMEGTISNVETQGTPSVLILSSQPGFHYWLPVKAPESMGEELCCNDPSLLGLGPLVRGEYG